MRFLDQFGKAANNVIDRARFEAEKFQKTSRIQGELGEIKQRLDAKWIEMGQRAYDLYHTGTMQTASFADLIQEVDRLRVEMTKKEDELRIAQAENYIEPEVPPDQQARTVPVEQGPPPPPNFKGQQTPRQPTPQAPSQPAPQAPQRSTPPAQQDGTAAGKKTCPACSFQMPNHAVFCPNCGFRVGTTHLS
jgi:hypothetical protein